MKKFVFINIFILKINFILSNSIKFKNKEKKINESGKHNIIHFLKCGHGDAILIEGNDHYGLIDSSHPYNDKNNLNKNKNKNQTNEEDNSIILLNYLKGLKIKKLEFIIITHAHSDHIGGIQAISSKYVDNSTFFYYKKCNFTNNLDKYINHSIYLSALNSVNEKNVKLVDVTNKNINFNFGDMNIELINTYIDTNEIILDENQNSILILIKINNMTIFLPGDMTKINEYKIHKYLEKINVIKLPHHGFGDTSIKNLRKLKPDNIIISSNFISPKAVKLIKYMKNKYKSKIYALNYIKNISLKLFFHLNNTNKYYSEIYYSEVNESIQFILMNNKINSKIDFNMILLIFYIIIKIINVYSFYFKKLKTFLNSLIS